MVEYATRSDLLPPDWITELERLHSQAATLPFEMVRPAIEEALGEPVSKAFAAFDPEPLAAASMAQVHLAHLHDGRAIVLKVRRPGIRPRMEADLRLIAQFAAVLERASAEIRRFAPTALVQQLASAILEELDFTNEARNADRLRADLVGNAQVVIPGIHWEWTSETLLAMDYVEGSRRARQRRSSRRTSIPTRSHRSALRSCSTWSFSPAGSMPIPTPAISCACPETASPCWI